jgi:uncharacterized protein (DUF488 family)
VEIYTIGFTKKSAREFFGTLSEHGIRRLIDVRLNNVSQLSGFSKKDDLAFFLETIVGAEYLHEPLLAPTQEMLNAYRGKAMGWPEYEALFLRLMREREIEAVLDQSMFDAPTALLCSEPTQSRCHRRLIVDYLDQRWGDVKSSPL